ncbi:chemotaxis protein CheW [Aestuariivirga litoralis]|uniref:chemotaxis protein CheW n=1 Tax=Aestuariivirga litoralis TaxID=2650924 RepID=UPI0018C6DB26|nr:chemotaxis protein CheW [Aestuariivirga litoralis]MBG1231795.1 chemotaxis protein CheW [Aestuariivirga litoralis]
MALSGSNNGDRELVIFKNGELEYCIDIMQVREIRGWTTATPIPRAPDYMVGVINLRGTVLPVLDLKMRLGGEKSEPTVRHAIIVVQGGDQLTGLLVEGVSDIISIKEDMLHPTPDVSSAIARSFVTGIVTLEGRMISLLSLEEILPKAALEAA